MQSYCVDRYRGVGPGWGSIFKRLLRDLHRDNPNFLLLDAEAKGGALHVYIARGGAEAERLIGAAQERSRSVCMVCGAPGGLKVNRLEVYQVRCAKCGRHWAEPPELPMFPAVKVCRCGHAGCPGA
jgi:ribosomal protein L37AE/L43A